MSTASALAAIFISLFLAPAVDTELEARRTEALLLHRVLDVSGLQVQGRDGLWRDRSPPAAHVTVFHIWAVECGPCVAELPRLRDITAGFRGERGIRFIFVTETDDDTLLRKFLVERRSAVPKEPVYRDLDGREGRLRHALGVLSQPLTLVVDRDFVVRQAFIGSVEMRRNELVDSIERLLRAVK